MNPQKNNNENYVDARKFKRLYFLQTGRVVWLDPEDVVSHEIVGNTQDNHPVLRCVFKDGSWVDAIDICGAWK